MAMDDILTNEPWTWRWEYKRETGVESDSYEAVDITGWRIRLMVRPDPKTPPLLTLDTNDNTILISEDEVGVFYCNASLAMMQGLETELLASPRRDGRTELSFDIRRETPTPVDVLVERSLVFRIGNTK